MKSKKNTGSMAAIIVIALYLMIPLFFTFLYSMFREWMDILPTGFTLSAYVEIFSDMSFGPL